MSDTVELDTRDLAEVMDAKEKPLTFSFAAVEYGHSIMGLPVKPLRAMEQPEGPIDLAVHIDTQMQLFEDTARVIRDSGIDFVRADFVSVQVNKANVQILSHGIPDHFAEPTSSGRLTMSGMSEGVPDHMTAALLSGQTDTRGHLLKVHIEKDDEDAVVIKGSLPKKELKDFGLKIGKDEKNGDRYKNFAWSRVDADASGTPGYHVTGELPSGIRVDLLSHD